MCISLCGRKLGSLEGYHADTWRTCKLHTDNTNTILLATMIIMDTEKYEEQMKTMLKDNNIHEELKKDLTEEKKWTLRLLLKPLVSDLEENSPEVL